MLEWDPDERLTASEALRLLPSDDPCLAMQYEEDEDEDGDEDEDENGDDEGEEEDEKEAEVEDEREV
jgi:hypothetical protein